VPNPKILRWLDLLAALLARRSPATFLDFARDVPAYLRDGSVAARKPSPTVKRMFERDKLELRELGIPLESEGDEGDEERAYVLRTKDFYLPYLALMTERGLVGPSKVDRYGYHSLATLAFEPDELEAIRDAASRVTQVGDPALSEDTRSALQKLAFDLPMGATDGPSGDAAVISTPARPDPRILAALGEALIRRKAVSVVYQGAAAGEQTERTLELYGLFFLLGHWYVAAHDRAKEGVRNFRVSRVRKAIVSASSEGTPDYTVPTTFVLREHAKSRRAWEIGDGGGLEALVEFRGSTGAVRAASALGQSVEGNDQVRLFSVRRVDTFARWLLSFGGDAVPQSPTELVSEYEALVERTRALYARPGAV
jgi:proteasome accessory factor B